MYGLKDDEVIGGWCKNNSDRGITLHFNHYARSWKLFLHLRQMPQIIP